MKTQDLFVTFELAKQLRDKEDDICLYQDKFVKPYYETLTKAIEKTLTLI